MPTCSYCNGPTTTLPTGHGCPACALQWGPGGERPWLQAEIFCDFLPSETHPFQHWFDGETLSLPTLEDIRDAAPAMAPGQAGWLVRWGYVMSSYPGVVVHVSGRESKPHPWNGLTTRERVWSYIPLVGTQDGCAEGAVGYHLSRLQECRLPTYGEPRASHAGREWEESAGGCLMATQMHWDGSCWICSYGSNPFGVENWGQIEMVPAARMAA